MIDEINKEIEQINSNINVLPTNNKKNIAKYVEYINECLTEFETKLEECRNEVILRKNNLAYKYESIPFNLSEVNINYDDIKLSDIRCASNEKMNLNYLIYRLKNSTSDGLNKMNEILLEIIDNFKKVNIILTEKDFNHTEEVNLYIRTLLYSKDDIQNVFNEIYFKNPELINEICLNIWYLYYKNKSKIDNYYKEKYKNFDFHNYIADYRKQVNNQDNIKHSNVKNIYNMFKNSELDVNEYLDESKMSDLANTLVVNPDDEKNYDNLVNYKKSLIEFKGYSKYQFIIADFKELFTHKEEYKTLFNDKLKEISKEESKLFGLNKKINKKGLFKLNKEKLATAKLDRDKTLENLNNLYNELDDISIKDVIKNYFNNETNYYDALKLTTYNFNYFIKLLVSQDIELSQKVIDENLLDLQKYIYDMHSDVIDNIILQEDKDVLEIISNKYRLNGILVDSEKINSDQIDKVINNVDKLLIYYDIKKLNVNLNEIKYIIDSSKELTKEK